MLRCAERSSGAAQVLAVPSDAASGGAWPSDPGMRRADSRVRFGAEPVAMVPSEPVESAELMHLTARP
jgi:hypothetical protein